MITLRRSDERGHADHGWLDARHTFSFADYHDPDFMGFSELRVLNQDRIQPARGFGTHGHRDMEIVTYVLEGVLQHRDSMGNGSLIRNGEVQLMSAGTGVMHSEFNASEDEGLHLLQMWVMPAQRGTEPRYEQVEFPRARQAGSAAAGGLSRRPGRFAHDRPGRGALRRAPRRGRERSSRRGSGSLGLVARRAG